MGQPAEQLGTSMYVQPCFLFSHRTIRTTQMLSLSLSQSHAQACSRRSSARSPSTEGSMLRGRLCRSVPLEPSSLASFFLPIPSHPSFLPSRIIDIIFSTCHVSTICFFTLLSFAWSLFSPSSLLVLSCYLMESSTADPCFVRTRCAVSARMIEKKGDYLP
jgi:hypothetical protein